MKYFNLISLLVFHILLGTSQPSGPGDVAFVGYNADGGDGFAIVTLVPIPAGSKIFFTDNEWNGTVLTSGEGTIEWSYPSGGTIPAGTVITFNPTTPAASVSVSVGIVASGSINLNADNEQLYAYIGTSGTPLAFLAGIANDDFTQNSNMISGTGLTVGTTAMQVNAASASADPDVMVYTGVNSGMMSFSEYLSLVNDPSNWITEDGTGDQSANSTAPDFPDDVPGNFTILTPQVNATVPTLGQWGLITLALMLLNMAIVGLKHPARINS